MAKKIIKKKISECCKAPMLGGVQCENCGSNGKFTTGTAVVKGIQTIINMLKDNAEFINKPSKIFVTEKKEEERFIDNGDGTISDTKTRLMWQKEGSQERLNYAQAEEFVAELNKEQYPDWRIPTREELESILDLERREPTINPMFECQSAGYWSSTPVADYTSFAWYVNFYDGYVYNVNRNGSYLVRPVRQY